MTTINNNFFNTSGRTIKARLGVGTHQVTITNHQVVINEKEPQKSYLELEGSVAGKEIYPIRWFFDASLTNNQIEEYSKIKDPKNKKLQSVWSFKSARSACDYIEYHLAEGSPIEIQATAYTNKSGTTGYNYKASAPTIEAEPFTTSDDSPF